MNSKKRFFMKRPTVHWRVLLEFKSPGSQLSLTLVLGVIFYTAILTPLPFYLRKGLDQLFGVHVSTYGWTKGFSKQGALGETEGYLLWSRGGERASAELRNIETTHTLYIHIYIDGDSCRLTRMINAAIHLPLFSISPPSHQQLKNGSMRGGGQICKKNVNTSTSALFALE